MECGKTTHFTIHTRGAGKAKPDVKFLPPRGEYSAPAKHPEIIHNEVYSSIKRSTLSIFLY